MEFNNIVLFSVICVVRIRCTSVARYAEIGSQRRFKPSAAVDGTVGVISCAGRVL
jgi:hypothetical protein